jgi:hypothetical protein
MMCGADVKTFLPGTVSFFQAMAPILIANVLTVTFVYAFVNIGAH